MKRPQRELSIGVWVNNSQILAPKPVPGNLGSTGLFVPMIDNIILTTCSSVDVEVDSIMQLEV